MLDLGRLSLLNITLYTDPPFGGCSYFFIVEPWDSGGTMRYSL